VSTKRACDRHQPPSGRVRRSSDEKSGLRLRYHYLPEVYRPRVTALKSGPTAHLSGWDNDL